MMFKKIPGNFFVPLSSPHRVVDWECLCRLFSLMEHCLSFGIEREVLADELQFYFDGINAAEFSGEECQGTDSRGKANYMLRKLEYYGWIEVETDRSYVQRVNFKEHSGIILLQIHENMDRLMTGLKNLHEEKEDKYFLIGAIVDSPSEGQETVIRYLLDNRRMEDTLFLAGTKPKSIAEFRNTTENIKAWCKTQGEARKVIRPHPQSSGLQAY